MMRQIAYICNQKDICNDSPQCGKECTRTFNEDYAKNPRCDRSFKQFSSDIVEEVTVNHMFWFKDRKKIADAYDQWIKDNKLKDCSFNMVSFLVKLLDYDKTKKFLKDIEADNMITNDNIALAEAKMSFATELAKMNIDLEELFKKLDPLFNIMADMAKTQIDLIVKNYNYLNKKTDSKSNETEVL